MSDQTIDRTRLRSTTPRAQTQWDKALTNAVKKSVAEIDGMRAKELKAGLAEAQAGMGG
jgi:hypothetical protein